jgi:hypothetical protein
MPIFGQKTGFRASIMAPPERNKIRDSMLCFVVCKIVARWVYNNTRMRLQRCVANEWFDALYFVKWLQDGFTTTHMRALQRCVAISGLMLCSL